ncbi:hypothetical protein [Microcella sp.]|uniref:hypothetical protein n=1 Tax=Microcella sp. TaxID=1913979 RepID=UPI0026092AB1|nr:hypothetical protein [Microcella sp.]
MTRTRWAALGMAGLLAFYLVVVLGYAARLIADPVPVAQAIGWALVVLPVIGAWALAAEIVFGFRAESLARRLEADGGMPREALPASASGRIERQAADEAFERYAAEVRQNPHDWQHWFRLALAYDAARDRRRARWALREAIRINRGGQPRGATGRPPR